MIYKIVAVIGVIFLIIFGLIVYSAVTLPAKTLVDSTSAGSQQVISTQLSESAVLSTPRPAVQLPIRLQETPFVLENRTSTSESLFVYGTHPQISSERLEYRLPQIPQSARLSNEHSPLFLLNQV